MPHRINPSPSTSEARLSPGALSEQLREARTRIAELERQNRDLMAARLDSAENSQRHERGEVALGESLAKIKSLELALDEHALVAITDQRGRITYANDKFCAVSKYSREELLGQDHRIINSDHHGSMFMRDLWQTIQSGRTWKGEIRNRAKDGTFYWVDTTIVPFLDAAGKPYQYVAIRADITERKRAEADLRQAEEEKRRQKIELEHASRLTLAGQMAAAMAHELNQPLGATANYIDTAVRAMRARPGADATAIDMLSEAAEQVQRAGQIVRRMLGFVGKNTHDRAMVDLNAAVQESVLLMSAEARFKRVSVRLSLTPGRWTVHANRLGIQQVICNLLGNAIQSIEGASSPRREVAVTTYIPSSGKLEACVRVEDSGPGIQPAIVERLFTAFHTGKQTGLGLGLWICRSLIEADDGRIWCDAAGPGAAFVFSLPLVHAI